MRERTSAWPLALLFAGLILYASLYPFGGWRVQGVQPWAWLWAPWPQYWTRFDLIANFLGYVPLGFLVAVSALRLGRWRAAWALGCGLPLALSFAVECAQTFLPGRVPSNVDFALNALGGLLGTALAAVLQRWGALGLWGRFRTEWFEPGAHGGLVLLMLWPLALLYPLAVPFGLGQVWDRLANGLSAWFQDTPFLDWLPARGEVILPLGPLSEALCVALGLLAPLLIAYGDMRSAWRRLVLLPVFLLVSMAFAGLSSVLTYGPSHAWAWLNLQVSVGLWAAAVLGAILVFAPRRLCHALMLMCLAISVTLLNRTSEIPYFVQSVEAWEQGRFIRFHGLSQWLGWLWPYAALLFGLRALSIPPGSRLTAS